MAVMNQSIIDLGQLNLEEIIRKIREEEVVRMLNIIIENNTKILELQSMLVTLMKNEENKKQEKQQRKMRRSKKEERKEKKKKKEKG